MKKLIVLFAPLFITAAMGHSAPESFFIGCRPTTGECVMSCPERNGFGMTDSVICGDDLEPVACFCPATSQHLRCENGGR